ncbi:ankyrin repeat domain-containing protein [Noviherbaspirillum galbum]|uniref:ShET2/EspL2 family type III secretion system effector toxin n=1 Tax=Noviherbaspirillum galbum TaxID=2709383 RepID=A0A6B3SWC9_9BURK|nr:ankyrin repeat domain-containing protein [Noviherbaspirillum galbum]NEX61989.1 ShET2/EspL2 family type III secretion system effector toxin [Noviherbaspirillum galbum]
MQDLLRSASGMVDYLQRQVALQQGARVPVAPEQAAKSRFHFSSRYADRMVGRHNGLANVYCRHWSTLLALMLAQARLAGGPVRMREVEKRLRDPRPFLDPRSREALEQAYLRLKQNAPVTLIDNRYWPVFLGEAFAALERGDFGASGEAVYLLESVNHTMLVQLRLKRTGEDKRYGVNFFDPNLTTIHAHAGTGDLDQADWSLRAMLGTSYGRYFPPGREIAAAIDVTRPFDRPGISRPTSQAAFHLVGDHDMLFNPTLHYQAASSWPDSCANALLQLACDLPLDMDCPPLHEAMLTSLRSPIHEDGNALDMAAYLGQTGTLGTALAALAGNGVTPEELLLARDSKQLSLLHCAVMQDDSRTVRLLIDYALDDDEEGEETLAAMMTGDCNGLTPLHHAVARGRLEHYRMLRDAIEMSVPELRFLYAERTNRNQSVFHLAVKSGNRDLLRELLHDLFSGTPDHENWLALAERLHAPDAHGNTVMHLAAAGGDPGMVTLLAGLVASWPAPMRELAWRKWTVPNDRGHTPHEVAIATAGRARGGIQAFRARETGERLAREESELREARVA